MKKLELSQMENLQGGGCKSIELFGWGYHWGSNEGSGEPVWISTGLDIISGQETGYWQASPNTCEQGWG